MYRIYNKSLDKSLKKFNKQKLNDLTDDELVEVCATQKLAPVFELDDKRRPIKVQRFTVPKRRGKKRTLVPGTITKLESENSASFYMDDYYWLERHRELAADRNLSELVATAKTGDKVFAAYEDLGFGVAQLKPGEEIELDLAPAYVRQILKNPEVFPQAKLLKVTNISEESEKLEQKIQGMTFGELQNEARKINKEKETNIKFVATSIDKLRGEILRYA